MQKRGVVLLILFMLPFLTMAQRSRTRRLPRESWDRVVINQFFKENKPQTTLDTAFYNSYQYLNYQIVKDTSGLTFSKLIEVINANRPMKELKVLQQFYDSVKVKNERFAAEMVDARMKWYLKRSLDTMEITSTDSLFDDMLELLSDNSTNYDSLVSLTTPYTDTLVKSLAKNISDVKRLPIFSQIKKLRNDTVSFNLVNINGDTTKIRLFDDNPYVVRTTIKNLAGDEEPLLIRDIHKNSFRLIINDSQEIEVEDPKKTYDIFADILAANRPQGLTITKRYPPEDVKSWFLGGKFSIDATQMTLHNWIKGGENTITLSTTLELTANYKNGYNMWENKGVFKYGSIQQGEKSLRTNEDKINITSVYGYRAFSKFYYSAQLEFKSQFAPTYSYTDNTKTAIVSKFFAPATLTIGAGMEYKPNNKNSFIVTPITSKNTFVLSDTVSHSKYSVDEDKSVRSETGFYAKANNKFKIIQNIEINSTLELFSNYFEKPQNIDIDWNLEIVFPINYYVRATISTEMIYDDDQNIPVYNENREKIGDTKGLQFKELLKLGIVFRF